MDPFDTEPMSIRDIVDSDSLTDILEDMVPDYATEGVGDLVSDYLEDLDFDDLWELYELWEDDAAFWDWFRDEFYAES